MMGYVLVLMSDLTHFYASRPCLAPTDQWMVHPSDRLTHPATQFPHSSHSPTPLPPCYPTPLRRIPMKTNATLVVIGAGIVGCSTTYHLAKQGWKDIVVVEQGPLFATGGSTSHAPGLVFQTNPSKTMTKLAQYTIDLYSQLSTDEGPAFYPVGGIEVAYTEARMAELQRKLGWAKSWGVEDATLLTPEEVKAKVPLIDETKILGAYYVPSDGIAKALRAAEALANYAKEAGAAEFYGNTTVLDIEVVNGQVKAVVTDKGRIETDKVLVCAGIWGPRIGRMVGEVIPLTPVQHQYVKTAPIPELAGETEEVNFPMVRHQDHAMYFRQHGDCWGIGSYQHEPLLVDPDNISALCGSARDAVGQALHRRAFRPRLGIHHRTLPRPQACRVDLQNQRYVFLHAGQRFGNWGIDEGQGLLGGGSGVGDPRWRRRQNRGGTHDHGRS
jgi:glycine/D-amino acid oxidase-like deaminating enzyme